MGIMECRGYPVEWKITLQDSSGDESKCCKPPVGWGGILRDYCRNATLCLNFVGHLKQQKVNPLAA